MAFADYTGVIGRGIGTLVGAWFGGPAGAYAGGMAGQMEGDKFGDVLKGDSDIFSMLSPGPAPQKPPAPPIQLDPQGRMGNWAAPEMGALTDAPATRATMAEANDPPSGGFDFGRLLTGIGRTMSGTAAGLQGDNDYFNRLQQQMDAASERTSRTKLAEKELESREQDRAVHRSKGLLEALKMANEAAADIDGDPEKAKLPTKIFKVLFENGLPGAKFEESEIQEYLTRGAGAFDAIAGLYEGIDKSGMLKDPVSRKALKDKTISLPEADKLGKEKLSEVAFSAASELAKQDPEGVKKMTWDEYQKRIPHAKYTSDEQFNRLGEMGYTIKPAAQLKKEKESEVIEGRQSQLKAETEINTERRHQEDLAERRRSGNRLEQQTAATIALGQGNLAMRQKEFGRREEVSDRLTQAEREPLENTQQAFRITKDLADAHATATAGDRPLSGAIRGLLNQQITSGTKLTQIGREQINKLSPAEQKLAAQFNVAVGNLRAMTPERQLSNEDATRNLVSFMLNNSPKQVRENLTARLKDQEVNFNSRRENIRGGGKSIPPNLERVDVQVGAETPATSAATAAAPMRNKSKSGKPIISNDGGKTWTYE